MRLLTLNSKPVLAFGLSAILYATVPAAFAASNETDADSGSVKKYECNDDGCRTQSGLIFRVKSDGEDKPTAKGNDESSHQKNRRVDVNYQEIYTYNEEGFTPDKKRVDVTSNMMIQLENGGLLWATEDPALTQASLNVNGPNTIAFVDGRIAEEVNFSYYNNYGAFIKKLEIVIFEGTDDDLVTPLSTLEVPVSNNGKFKWNGDLTLDKELVIGEQLKYLIRAYDAEGRMDETYAKNFLLVSEEEKKSNISRIADTAPRDLVEQEGEQQIANELIETQTYGNNNLRQQNIPIYGSRVRIFGQDIPAGERISINGQDIPVGLERKFVAEYLMPVGQHKFDVAIGDAKEYVTKQLEIDVTGKYMFIVALADITLSENKVSDSIQAVDEGDKFDDDFLVNGRLAFYLKGKIQGKYLITAQADTRERELEDLFEGFLDKDPQDVFRRLDPDRYYPVYGDDSNVYRDVDTQGKFYVRVDWDKSQAIWGNYNTGITGTEFAQYGRSLYGAAISWRSIETTELGESKTQLKAFASEAQTALGHNEFLGTGGSLYYLRNTDILPGSDRVVLEVRDNTTGLVETTVTLQRGADYEIDEIQGRIILTRPLNQISRQNMGTIIRDEPLDGFDNILLVDYEYLPTGFNSDETTLGGRAKVWLGDHVAIGGTFVDENRAGDDYELQGVDVTLQAGRGTYLKVEKAKTNANQAASYFSDNGGFSFTQLAADPLNDVSGKEGDAYSIEARANFKELGWTENQWTAGAWHRETDSDFSIARRTLGEEVTETGAEFTGEINKDVTLSARVSEYERGTSNKLEQAQVNLAYQVTPKAQVTAEVRQLEETISGNETSATLGALQYKHRIGETWDIYTTGQFTLENDGGNYDNNDLITIGTKYLFGQRSSIGAEYSSGHRGDAATLTADYYVNSDYSLYGRYTYSTDSSNSVFGPSINDGITLGQRWRVSNQVTLYNESQYLKAPQETGLAHTFGIDFIPSTGWNIGINLQDGELENVNGGVIDRQAASVSGSYRSPDLDWTSKLEYRDDSGAENREQWLTTNRITYRLSDDWRLAARLNHSDTEDLNDANQNARFTEANLGFAYRPVNNASWALLGKYTYLYDLRTLAQVTTGADQKSDIYALEGIYNLNPQWQFAGKLAHRRGQVRQGRGTGDWFSSTVDLYALQTRYHLVKNWDALAEYRWLKSKENDDKRQGWLIGADYHISDHFKVGLGYNFTDFSDNLANLDYEYEGFFLNFVGKY